ncbi:Cytochrome c oxidase assembly protein [Globisporangium polare]
MGKSCRDMAEALRDCMVLEECMSDGTRTLKQCLKLKEYSHECRGYRQAYFECKRGQLDMRTRIRGPKGGLTKPEPVAKAKE